MVRPLRRRRELGGTRNDLARRLRPVSNNVPKVEIAAPRAGNGAVRIRLYAGNSEYPALLAASAAVTMRPVRTISREVLVTPQRPYAGHPLMRMMRWSELHGDMQGNAVQNKARFRSVN